MTVQFTTVPLTGERTLVRGEDVFGVEGEVVLDASQWNHVKSHQAFAKAADDFDAAVEEFFAPLNEALDKIQAAAKVVDVDPDSFVVIHEGEEGTEGSERVVEHLTRDSIVLRLIERGDFDRLVWVNNELEIQAILPGTNTPTAVQTATEELGAEPLPVEG